MAGQKRRDTRRPVGHHTRSEIVDYGRIRARAQLGRPGNPGWTIATLSSTVCRRLLQSWELAGLEAAGIVAHTGRQGHPPPAASPAPSAASRRTVPWGKSAEAKDTYRQPHNRLRASPPSGFARFVRSGLKRVFRPPRARGNPPSRGRRTRGGGPRPEGAETAEGATGPPQVLTTISAAGVYQG